MCRQSWAHTQTCQVQARTHTHTPHTHAHTHVLTPSTSGPPRRAHLVNLAETWAHIWFRHNPTVQGSPGMCLAGPEAPSGHRSHPRSGPSYSCFPNLQVLSPGPPSFPARYSHSRTLGSQESQQMREGSLWPGRECGLPLLWGTGALGHPSPKPGLFQGFFWILV